MGGGYVFLILLLVSIYRHFYLVRYLQVFYWEILRNYPLEIILHFCPILGGSIFIPNPRFVRKLLRLRTSRRRNHSKCRVLEELAVKHTGN